MNDNDSSGAMSTSTLPPSGGEHRYPLHPNTLAALRKTGRPILVLDWKPKRLDVCSVDETDIAKVVTVKEPLRTFVRSHPKHVIIFERTAESYNPVERNAVIDMATDVDTLLFTTNQHHTRVEDPTNDRAAALAIAACVRGIDERYELRRMTRHEPGPDTLRARYEAIRRGKARDLRAFVDSELPGVPRLRAEGLVSYPLLASLIPSMEVTRHSRRWLTRVIGMHGTGAPSFYRSQVERRIKTLTLRELHTRSLKRIPRESWSPVFHYQGKLLRHELVKLHHSFWSARDEHENPPEVTR